MASYRIVCTVQEPLDKPHEVAHIVLVGVGTDPQRASGKWTLKQVLDALKLGNTFYTVSLSTDKVASVNEYVCKTCNRVTIRSNPDALRDNNLDSLRKCNFS